MSSEFDYSASELQQKNHTQPTKHPIPTPYPNPLKDLNTKASKSVKTSPRSVFSHVSLVKNVQHTPTSNRFFSAFTYITRLIGKQKQVVISATLLVVLLSTVFSSLMQNEVYSNAFAFSARSFANQRVSAIRNSINLIDGENDRSSVFTKPSSAASCEDPIGWVEKSELRNETSKTYAVPMTQDELDSWINTPQHIEKNGKTVLPRRFSYQTNPELYKSVVCSNTDSLHFIDIFSQDGYKEISSDIIEIEAIENNTVDIKEQSNDSKREAVESVLSTLVKNDTRIEFDTQINTQKEDITKEYKTRKQAQKKGRPNTNSNNTKKRFQKRTLSPLQSSESDSQSEEDESVQEAKDSESSEEVSSESLQASQVASSYQASSRAQNSQSSQAIAYDEVETTYEEISSQSSSSEVFSFVSSSSAFTAPTEVTTQEDTLSKEEKQALESYLTDSSATDISEISPYANKTNKGYIYTNAANRFTVLFNVDPNKGFIYIDPGTNVDSSDDIVLKTTNVTISDYPLAVSTPVVDGNTITYSNVLPATDLVYTVTSTGIQKEIVLTAKEALANDLSRIQFTFADPLPFVPITKEESEEETRTEIEETLAKNSEAQTIIDGVDVSQDSQAISYKNAEGAEVTKGDNSLTIGGAVTFEEADTAAQTGGVTKEEKWVLSADSKTYTIFPDTSYLEDEERVFPIRIDPNISYQGAYAYGFSSVYGAGKGLRNLLNVGKTRSNTDTTTNGSFGTTQTHLAFSLPSDLTSQSTVHSARLSVNAYQVNGSFRAGIYQVDRGVPNANTYWNSSSRPRAINGQRGYIDFSWYQNKGGTKTFTSTNIENFVDLHTSGGANYVQMVFKHDSGSYAGAFFCSPAKGTFNVGPCPNTSKGPYLSLEYTSWENQGPSTPQAEFPVAIDYLGDCDQSNDYSYTTVKSGNCTPFNTIPHQLANVTDGGDNGDYAQTSLEISNQNARSWKQNVPKTVTSNQNIGEGTVRYNQNMPNGIITWDGQVTDKYGAQSGRSNTGSYILDTSSPYPISSIYTDSNTIFDNANPSQYSPSINQTNLPEFTGRDPINPDSSTPQLSFTLPTYVDNIGYRSIIKPAFAFENDIMGEYSIDLLGGYPGANQGIGVWYNNSHPTSQQWIFENNALKIAGFSEYCLDSESFILGAGFAMRDCNYSDTQQWVYSPLTKQIKSLTRNDLCISLTGRDVLSVMIVQACDQNNILQQFIIDRVHMLRIQNERNSSLYIDSAGAYTWHELVWKPESFEYQDWYYFENDQTLRPGDTNLCVDGRGISNGDSLYLFNCHGGDNQKWVLKNDGTIRSKANTNMCVDIYNSQVIQNNQIRLHPCHGGSTQRFRLKNYGSNVTDTLSLQYQVEVSTDQNFSTAQTINTGWQDSQQFQLAGEVNPSVQFNAYVDGTVMFAYNPSESYPNLYLRAGKTDDTTDTYAWEDAGDGYYYIKNNEGLCLDNYSPVIAQNNDYNFRGNEGRLYFYHCHGGDNQRFRFDAQNKRIVIKRRSTEGREMCMYPHGGYRNGNLIRVKHCDDVPAYIPGAFNLDSYEMKEVSSPTSLSDNESYHIRVKAKDRSYAWKRGSVTPWLYLGKTTLDYTRPSVTNLSLSSSVVNTENPATITASISEKHTQSIELTLIGQKDGKDTVLKTFSTCSLNGGESQDCSYITSITDDSYTASFSFDGVDDEGNEIKDGIYQLDIRVTDKAGNTNKNTAGSMNIIALDNSPATISVIYPTNGAWVNEKDITLQGAVAGLNTPDTDNEDVLSYARDRDIKQATISKQETVLESALEDGSLGSTVYDNETISYNDTNNFSFETSLDLGRNVFSFETEDNIGNIQSQIGSETTNLYNNWEINYDPFAPQIDSITISTENKSSQSLISEELPTISDTSASFEISLSDPTLSTLANQGVNLISGIKTGTNPDMLTLSLIQRGGAGEIPLYKNGVNLTDSNSNPRLIGDITCSGESEYSATVSCTFNLANLQMDGEYTLFVSATDRASNTVCSHDEDEISQNVCTSINTPSTLDQSLFTESYTGESFPTFIVDTYTHLETPGILSQKNGQGNIPQINTAATSYTATIEVEKNTSLEITHEALSRSIQFTATDEVSIDDVTVIDTQTNETVSDFVTDFSGTCNDSIDHDSNDQTNKIETCTYTISLLLKTNELASYTNGETTTKPLAAKNTITINTIGVSIPQTRAFSLMHDVYSAALVVEASYQSFSPNNDEVRDTITFSPTIEGVENTQNAIESYSFAIEDENGSLVRSYWTGVSSLESFEWDGTTNKSYTSLSGSQITDGEKAEDGVYTIQYFARLLGTDVTVSTRPLSFTLVTGTEEITSIASPLSGYTTTRGVVIVQGQAPASRNGEEWTVTVCASLENEDCFDTATVQADDSGTYGVIVNLTAYNTAYTLTATATNEAGVTAPYIGEAVTIQYDGASSIVSADAYASLDGVTNKEVTDCLIDTSVEGCDDITIADARVLTVDIEVTQNTEAVEIDFAKNTYLSNQDTTDTTYTPDYRIGIINDKVDTNSITNPLQKSTLKFNHYGERYSFSDSEGGTVSRFITSAKDTTKANTTPQVTYPCNQSSCSWSLQYVLPHTFSGGNYEIRIKSYKGETVEEITRGFTVNGQIKTPPTVLRVDTNTLTDECKWENTHSNSADCQDTEYQKTRSIIRPLSSEAFAPAYYTNNTTIRAYIGADAEMGYGYSLSQLNTVNTDSSTPLDISPTNMTALVDNTFSSNSNEFVSITDANGNKLTGDTIATPSGLSAFDISLGEEGIYLLTLGQESIDIPGNFNTQTVSYTVLVVDKTAPTIDSVSMRNTKNSNAILPFSQPGDEISFTISSDEPTYTTSVVAQNGYVSTTKKELSSQFTVSTKEGEKTYSCSAIREIDLFQNTGRITLDDGLRTKLPSVCQREYGSATTSNSVLSLSTSQNGVYYPSILVTDLAGNSTLFGNDASTLEGHQNRVHEKLKNDTYYDYDPLAYATTIVPAIDYNRAVEDYNYPFVDRELLHEQNPDSILSKDISLILDGITPLRQQFDITGWGNEGRIQTQNEGELSNLISRYKDLAGISGDIEIDNYLSIADGINAGSQNASTSLVNSSIVEGGDSELTKLLSIVLRASNGIFVDRTVDSRLNSDTEDEIIFNPAYITNNRYAEEADSFYLNKDTDTVSYPQFVTKQNSIPLIFPVESHLRSVISITRNDRTIKNGEPVNTTHTLDIDTAKLLSYSNSQDIDTDKIVTFCPRTSENAGSEYNTLLSGIRDTYNMMYNFESDIQDDIITSVSGIDASLFDAGNCIAVFDFDMVYDFAKVYTVDESFNQNFGSSITNLVNPSVESFVQNNKTSIFNPDTNSLIDSGETNTANQSFVGYQISLFPLDFAGNTPLDEETESKELSRDTKDVCSYISSTIDHKNGDTKETTLDIPTAYGISKAITANNLSVNDSTTCTLLIGRDTQKPLSYSEAIDYNTAKSEAGELPQASGYVPVYLTGLRDNTNEEDVYKGIVTEQGFSRYITNQTSIQTNIIAERASDVVIDINDNQNKDIPQLSTPILVYNEEIESFELTDTIIVVKKNTNKATNDEGKDINDFVTQKDEEIISNLYLNETDNRDGCIDSNLTSNAIQTPYNVSLPAIKDRRIGTCHDGLYKLSYTSYDTVGNKATDQEVFIERDTVAPKAPTVSASKIEGNYLKETLSLSITGEGKSDATILVTANNTSASVSRSYTYNLGENGSYDTQNLMGILMCGGITYNISVTLTDNAGNVSEITTTSIVTGECPTCSVTPLTTQIPVQAENGTQNITTLTFQKPTKNQPVSYTSGYGSRNGTHKGIDWASENRTLIYPTARGTVIFTDFSSPHDYGKKVYQKRTGWYASNDIGAYHNRGLGNYVAIEHPQTVSGEIYVSIYAHLTQENVGDINVGDIVDINDPIGVMGSTGLSTGDHLHFQIEDKTKSKSSGEFYGRSINPTLLIGQTTSNLKTQVEVEAFCDRDSLGSSSEEGFYGEYDSIFDIDQPEIDLSLDRYENVITHESNLKAVKPVITSARSTQDGDGLELYGLSMFSGINNVRINSFKQDTCNENLEKWSIPYFDSCKVTRKNKNNSTAILNGIELSFDLYDRDTDKVIEWDIKTIRPSNNQNIPAGETENTVQNSLLLANGNKSGRFNHFILRDFNEDDRICSKVKAIESIQFEGVSFRIDTQYENDMQLWGGCYDVEDSIKAITDSFWVSGGFWNHTDTLKNDRVESNRANREIFIRGGDRLNDNKFAVPDNANIWIVSHGWNDESRHSDTWKSIAESIEKDDPNAIALRLDWSNASFNGKHEWDSSIASTVMSLGFDGHCKAATWIAPVVDELKNKLDYWGVKPEQMHTVGHSLGSLLNAELASRYSTLIEKQISLDPPSESGCKGGYSIRNGNGNIWKADYEAGEKRKDFSNKAKISYSLVGRHSGAGSQELAKTSDRSFWVEFDSWTPNGEEHSWVVDTFKLINSDDRLTNVGTIPKGYLSTSDTTNLSNLQRRCGAPGTSGGWDKRLWECHHGIIEVGNPRDNSKKTMNRWNHKRKFVEDGDVEHMFMQTEKGVATIKK